MLQARAVQSSVPKHRQADDARADRELVADIAARAADQEGRTANGPGAPCNIPDVRGWAASGGLRRPSDGPQEASLGLMGALAEGTLGGGIAKGESGPNLRRRHEWQYTT